MAVVHPKDGDFFRDVLDSPEQGLLGIVIWSDIEPQSGGTDADADSVAPVARHLADDPGGCSGARRASANWSTSARTSWS